MQKISIILLLLLFPLTLNAEAMCHYSTYKWNTLSKTAVDFKEVNKPYQQLSPLEKDPRTGCTVCEEDQSTITLPGLKPFQVCKYLAPKLEQALLRIRAAGEPLLSITGYRVGMTKGDADKEGDRTRFSNHSFGIAIDINRQQNGLYANCLNFGPQCQLLQGGPWRAGQHGSLTHDSFTVRALKSLGLVWGGEIPGKQKDFMHFSPTGY